MLFEFCTILLNIYSIIKEYYQRYAPLAATAVPLSKVYHQKMGQAICAKRQNLKIHINELYLKYQTFIT